MATADPLPETVRQHLAATAQHELDALRAELDVRLIALETALARPDSGASLESLVLDLARVVAAEAESAAARASLEAQLHAQEDSAAVATQLQRQLDAERANASAIQLELDQVHAALDAERGAAQTLRLELAQTKTSLDSEHEAAARLREEFDELRESQKGASSAGDAPRRHVDELEQALKTERARSAEIEAELELQRDSAAHLSEALAALQRQLAASQQRAADARASEAEAHRAAVESLDRRYAELERQHHIVTANVAQLSTDRDGLAKTLDVERSQAAAAQTAAADAHRAAIEALERRYAELEGEFGAANDLASEAAAERDALAAKLETERQQAAATLESERQQAAATLEGERTQARATLETERQQSVAARDAAADAHRKAIEVLEGRCATLESESHAAAARAAEAIDARNALAVAAEAEREQAVLVQEAADDAHRATVETLEGRITELEGEYGAATALTSEVASERDALAATLEEERQEAAAEREAARDAHRAATETLERRIAALEGDYHAANTLVAEVSGERDALTAALEDERRKGAAAHAADDETHRAAVDAAERRYAELDRQHTEAAARASKVEEERAALAAALDAERQQAAEARAAAETRVASIDTERLNAERSRLDAEARVEEAASDREGLAAQRNALIAERDELVAERDDLIARLDAAERMSQDMRTAVEGRLSTIDDVHKRAVRAKEQAEARADATMRERDALASELAAVRQAAPDADPEIALRLEAATERIRVLELELFQRDRGPRDRDVDLVPLLDTTKSPPSPQAGKSAKRYAFPAATNIRIDREGGLLADLSVTGAQVIVKTSPEVGRVVTLALLSDEAPCFCEGQLMWARREQTAKGRPYRYRVGLMFTSADEAAIEAFIKAHAIG